MHSGQLQNEAVFLSACRHFGNMKFSNREPQNTADSTTKTAFSWTKINKTMHLLYKCHLLDQIKSFMSAFVCHRCFYGRGALQHESHVHYSQGMLWYEQLFLYIMIMWVQWYIHSTGILLYHWSAVCSGNLQWIAWESEESPSWWGFICSGRCICIQTEFHQPWIWSDQSHDDW